jgi:hypothetical protein
VTGLSKRPNGEKRKAKHGTQTYLCNVCGRRFHPEAQPVAHGEVTPKRLLDAVHERMSLTAAFNRHAVLFVIPVESSRARTRKHSE